MPKRTLQLSTWAEADLARIAEYTVNNWGERQLAKYRALLERGIAAIVRDPHAAPSKERDELFRGCRSLHVGRHVILYRINADTLQIARVLHDCMELERHIPNEFTTPAEE